MSSIPVPSASRRGVALMVLSGLNAVALLAVSLWLITRASAQPPIMYLQMAIVGVRAFALGRAFFRYVGRLASHESVFRALAEIRVSVFERLIHAAPQRLSTRKRGMTVATLVRDVDSLQDHALRFTEPLWVNAVVILMTTVSVIAVNAIAGLALGVMIAFAVATMVIIDIAVSRHSARELAPLHANLLGIVSERARFDDVIRAYDAADHYRERVRQIDSRIARALVAPALSSATATSIATALMGLTAILIVAVHPVDEALTFGNISPSFVLVALISLALGEFLATFPAMLEARRTVAVARERVARAVQPRGPVEAEADSLSSISQIDLTDVTAHYDDSGADVFAPVSFSASTGDVVVVRGSSGSGKSTLAAVLVGFLRPSRGTYTVDGTDSLSISPVTIRRSVGLCEQRPHIFAESIRHNLNFANPAASDADLWNVLDRVGLSAWARERDGLETFLGEAGALISGGQAQRIALARVLVADRHMIVLDEPTAELNSELANHLMSDILEATRDRILVILSHTPVTRVRATTEISLD